MAIIDPWNLPVDIKEMQYGIKGNMIKSQIIMTGYDLMKIDPQTFHDEIKMKLLYNLLDELMKTKSVEFTKMEDHLNFNTHFTVRMFAVPDDQVRILRVSQIYNTPT